MWFLTAPTSVCTNRGPYTNYEIYLGQCAHLVGHVKHEMMHTLGFYHEHSRSDRDKYIKIYWDHISEGNADQFQTYR